MSQAIKVKSEIKAKASKGQSGTSQSITFLSVKAWLKKLTIISNIVAVLAFQHIRFFRHNRMAAAVDRNNNRQANGSFGSSNHNHKCCKGHTVELSRRGVAPKCN